MIDDLSKFLKEEGLDELVERNEMDLVIDVPEGINNKNGNILIAYCSVSGKKIKSKRFYEELKKDKRIIKVIEQYNKSGIKLLFYDDFYN